ncbi:hypothetical protein MKX01_021864 [Papaver californicum]|nr:hypothetical protein MKX01_021864 [Papaver californicum]
MGNCQAVDTATLVIQHPSGKVERWYWPILAREIMKTNPGHYVALIISLCVPQQQQQQQESKKKQESQTMVVENLRVRITRVKILRPNDTLALGQAYRLISSEEAMKGVWAKKYAKMKKKELELMMSTDKPIQVCQKQSSLGCDTRKDELKITTEPPEIMINQGPKLERQRQRFTNSTSGRLRTWRPSLQSISEQAGS